MSKLDLPEGINGSEIAIVGMSGRFPGAKDIDAFWRNLQDGIESISFFSDEELVSSGIDSTFLNNPNYVKAKGILPDIELFDADFFGFSPKEAEMMDPQHRLFLECAWEAIENAGYNPENYEGSIGVYAGAGSSSYLASNIYPSLGLLDEQTNFQTFMGNEKDYLPTRVSYKLNLKGPSVSVQTACSTALVAVHTACQSLLNGECDISLAGGVSVSLPQTSGYWYQEGGVGSPDGHCRAFDAAAQGSVFGNGIGIVVLKRLNDAIAEGDCIQAIIRGSAINNDGALKAGYTAPSQVGQAAVISEAQAVAEIAPDTVTYVETHGTGTALGDPIEIAALTQAFRSSKEKKEFCAVGSVKTNFGHLGAAAGVASLIKTVLALRYKQIPPTLHFEKPNPKIDFANSPFYVNTQLSEWTVNGIPRRAGVSSLGIGGTNCHVVLEEVPVVETSSASRPRQLLVISAKTSSALETATTRLANHLRHHPELNLADVAYTLQIGRQAFNYRRMVVVEDTEDALEALESDPQRVVTQFQEPSERPVVFMFTGQGAQYVNMAQEIYQNEAIFRQEFDRCCELLKPQIGLDLRQLLYPTEEKAQKAAQQLQQTAITQPVLFAIEYALAKLWMAWGVHPVAMIGHSIGEYVAACLAGVFSLEDALALVSIRGQLMQQLPPGSMLAVPMPEKEVQSFLDKALALAAVNGPSSCVVSGPAEAVEALQDQLASLGVDCRRLHTSHAFHSQMMEPILGLFQERVRQVSLTPPQIPYVSNLTGTWITAEEATAPSYWASHLRQTVRFASGLQELLKNSAQVLLEVGPGRTLSKLAKQCPEKKPEQRVFTSLRHPGENQSDVTFLLNTLGQLWLNGVQIDWSGFYAHERRYRIPLPTYPFERQRHWIAPQTQEVLFFPTSIAPKLWQSLVKTGQLQASRGIPEFNEQTYLARKQELDCLCTIYINQTLRRLGVFSTLDERHTIEQLFEQCRIVPRYRQLLVRWLQVLVEQGHLQQDGEFFTNIRPLSTDSIQILLEAIRVRWADTPRLVDLIQHCGENLAAIIVGEKEPLEFFNAWIYQNENTSDQGFPLFGYCTSILQKSLEQVVKSLPAGVNLRILEIGAGMGITTAGLLPLLPSEQTNYMFTDIGSWFLKQAQQTFRDYPFIEYRLLDIENSPQDQGFESHSFDIVVASNVLHVTRNIGETLQHVRSLLAPEGFLLLWETTQPQLDFNISWGLLMNPIEDGNRSQANPFLSAAQWQEALHAHGFVEVAAFPEIEELGHQIIVAQASSSAELATPKAFTATRASERSEQTSPPISLGKKSDIADWFYIPSWKRSLPPKPLQATQAGCWLVFADSQVSDGDWELGFQNSPTLYDLGAQLVKQLEREGQDVVIVRIGENFRRENQSPAGEPSLYEINPRRQDDYEVLLQDLRTRNLTPKTIVHLWSVTPHNRSTSRLDNINRVQEKGFYSLLFLAQALGKQSYPEELQITVISNNMQALNGDELLCPEKSTLLGPVRVIPLEYPNIHCRSIDVVLPPAASWQAEKLANQLLAELKNPSSDDLVIAYRGAHRWVQTFEPVRLDRAVEETPRLRERGVYLITGGLGAIGLTLASHLAKTIQAKLVLTGRSPFPARADWSKWLSDHGEDDNISRKIRKVRELEELGAEVWVISADVSNFEEMQDVIAQVQEHFGQLNGIIHAAGFLGDSAIWRKTPEQVESVLAPKVKGTLVLDALLKGVELDFFALCSSIAAIQPLFGQVAHAGANNFLDAFAHYKTSADGTFVVSINWPVWQESGMEVEGTKQLALAPCQKIAQAQSNPVLHPLLDQCWVEGNEQEIYVSNLSVSKHWVLDEHRLMGKATLPGTAYLELLRAACESHAQSRTIEIQEFYFLTPLVVEEEKEIEVRTLLKKRGDGFEFTIVSHLNSGSESWREHARGKIALIEAQLPEKYAIQEIEASCNGRELILTEQESKLQTSFVEFGSRWNAISKQAKLSSDQGLIFLEMQEAFAADLNSYKLHPALLDIATGFLTVEYESAYLPFSYKNLRIKGALPSKIYSHIKLIENNQLQNEILKFNIIVMDEKGAELVEIEEYILRKVDREKADANVAKRSGAGDEKLPAAFANGIQKDFRENWLSSSEGIEVFDRILESTTPQILVSTVDLVTRSKQESTLKPELASKSLKKNNLSAAARPTIKLSDPHTASRTEIEQILLDIWQKILGGKQLGASDNFFELGGDSLIAVQVMSQVREILQIDLPVSSLFENPTIAGLAENIERVCRTAEKLQASIDGLSDDREEITL